MRGDGMRWEQVGERTWTMALPGGGADWVEVRRSRPGAAPAWHVDARLNGGHYKMADEFPTKEQAQGCALLLAMRQQVPGSRDALHAQLDAVPNAWWWKILPIDDASAEHRAIFSTRVLDSAEAAERSGRAAGAGWVLYVYGPGFVRTFGRLPR